MLHWKKMICSPSCDVHLNIDSHVVWYGIGKGDHMLASILFLITQVASLNKGLVRILGGTQHSLFFKFFCSCVLVLEKKGKKKHPLLEE